MVFAVMLAVVYTTGVYAQAITFTTASPQNICGATGTNINSSGGGCILPPAGGIVTCNGLAIAQGQATQFAMLLPALCNTTYKLTNVSLNFTLNSWGCDFGLHLRNPQNNYVTLMQTVGLSSAGGTFNGINICDTSNVVYPATPTPGIYKQRFIGSRNKRNSRMRTIM